jgi:hypothetical protein
MIIGFSGPKESGKTSSMNLYSAHLSEKKIDYKIYNFADKLKEVCGSLFNLSSEQVNTKRKDEKIPPIILTPGIIKKVFEKYEINVFDEDIAKKFQNIALFTPRQVLQIVGTDILRSHNENVHIDYLLNKIKKENPSVALIGDVRFYNEFLVCDQVLYIENKMKEQIAKISKIASETSVFTFKDKCSIIENNSSFENLNNQLGVAFSRRFNQ